MRSLFLAIVKPISKYLNDYGYSELNQITTKPHLEENHVHTQPNPQVHRCLLRGINPHDRRFPRSTHHRILLRQVESSMVLLLPQETMGELDARRVS
jgi:hypothetical protein